MSTLSTMADFVREVDELTVVLNSAHLTWEMKYDFIFNSWIVPSVHWADPDTSYKEDCEAFMTAAMLQADLYRATLEEMTAT